ncbi:coil containing protein, partial [Vibrio phage 1.182.O._10N.286.46.E1]
GKTVKQSAREVRREELRAYLSANNKVRQILDTVEKLEDLRTELESLEVQRLGKAAELRMSLLKKYLPDIKQQEITAEVKQSSADNWAEDDNT